MYMKNSTRGFIGIGAALLVGAALVAAGVAGFFIHKQSDVPAQTPQNEQGFGSVNAVAGVPYYLYGSGVGTSDTSVTLTSFKQPTNGYKLSMTDFGTTGYLTLEPGNSTRQEFVSFTGVTQNADGTATLTGVTRGLSFVSPFTASSTLQKAHAGGSTAVISNPPQFYERFAVKENTQYITGAWGFQGTAPTSTTCATANELCNKAYVDAGFNAGAATSTETNGGIVELGTLAEQASGFSGGANKPTVLQTKNSTSTCQVVGSYNIVASTTSGKLDKNCFDQTLNYTLSGTLLESASTTFTATTSISASSATNNALILNGVAYAAPSAQGIASSTLTNDGSGNMSWQRPEFTLIASTTLGSAVASTTLSWTMPATGGYSDLRVVISVPSFSSNVTRAIMTFNGDTGANYSWAVVNGVTLDAGLSAGLAFAIYGESGADASGFYATFNITNSVGAAKTLNYTGRRLTSAPFYGAGEWTNTTARITSITLGSGSANTMGVGTRISVYASRQ